MGKKVSVTSRNGGNVFYQIPEDGILRQFTNGETKMIDVDELKKLQFVSGGERVIRECLIIDDEETLKELNISVEPEYFYTEKEIKELLLEGSLEQLEDALNFAPSGVIDAIQKLSVQLELPDMRKRKLILEKTGFNITGAIDIMTDNEEETQEETTKRKAAPITKKEGAPQRKATLPDYKVIN